VIANARLSERSARGYRKVKSLTKATLERVTLILAQTPADAERFIRLGANAEGVRVTGNLKFDLHLPESLFDQAHVLRRRLFRQRPVWIAGSTHEGEEEAVLAAFAAVQKHNPHLLLALAPRHPERFADVASLCRRRRLPLVLRSQERDCADDTAVFLLDTLGELRLFYAASDIAFVGGSLVPKGGHNVLEPASAGVPVLFGPHMFNFADISRRLLEASAAIRVADRYELADAVGRLLSDETLRKDYGQQARDFVAQNRGALDRVLALLEPYLQPSSA
jgi:3-deoxy-D-manno-octulosonic-acid transferase